MATVYLAQDLKHDRAVAVKVLRRDVAEAVGAERFLAEIKVTANLQHPHILPLFDSGAAERGWVGVRPRGRDGEARGGMAARAQGGVRAEDELAQKALVALVESLGDAGEPDCHAELVRRAATAAASEVAGCRSARRAAFTKVP